MEKTNLNLIPEKEKPIVNASQFDDGRVVRFILKDGEDAYIPVGGESVACNIRKPDNNVVTISCTLTSIVEDEETIGSYVDVVLTEQANACVGEAFGELVLTKGDDFVIGTCNFVLAVERSPIAGGVTSTTVIDDLYTQVEEITVQVIGDDYYTKTQVDDLLDLKADAATTYTKTEVDAALALKADKSTTYTKTQVDSALALKADASSVYTKGQVDTALALKADAATTYTKTQVDDALALKADASSVYTKTQVDSSLALKADASSVYTKGQVDTALALKADASDVYTKTQVDNLLLNMMPVGSASGAIANFDTDLTLPLVDCKANIVASQASGTPTPSTPLPITGYSSANITRCGVNLCEEVWESGFIASNGVETPSVNSIRSKNYNPIKEGVSLYLYAPNVTTSSLIACYDADKNFLDYFSLKAEGRVITTPAGTAYFRISLYRYNGGIYDNAVSVNYPSTDTTYHAYNGQTYTVSFGQTVYGGVLDVTRGKLTVTHANIASYNGESINEPWLSSMDVYVPNTTPTTGAQVVYPLTTPVEVDLTPVQINALMGVNNVYNDTNGDTEVKYKDSIQHYIDTRT